MMRVSLPGSIALAAAYAIAGWVALQVAVPPYSVSQVFPPAGIALSALLIFGTGVWPGVAAGAAMVQLLASDDAGVSSLPILLAAPVGATVQALLGYWLAQRLIGFPNPLDTGRSIILFLLVVAPVSTLVNASVAVPALMLGGVISLPDAFFSWWNWWLGDSLGVIVAAPLMFVLFGRPRSVWRPRLFTVALPLLITLGLTMLAFQGIRDAEQHRIEQQFAREAEGVATLTAKRLDAQIDMIVAIERLVSHDPAHTAADFRRFVRPLLDRQPGTQNFTWNPRVRADERADLERAASQSIPGYRILDRVAETDVRVTPAAEAETYFPILHVEPLEGNRDVLGLNPASFSPAREAIDATLADGRPAVSAPFELTQERQAQRGVVVYHAVSGIDGDPPGLVSGAFRMDDLMDAVIGDSLAQDLRACLLDRDAAPGNELLTGAAACATEALESAPLSLRFPVPFAGRQWELRVVADDAFLRERRTWVAYATLTIGLVSTGLLGAFLLITSGQTRRIGTLVEQRTAELARTTRHLREQQDALARAQRIAHLGSWVQEAEDGLLRCSDGLRALLPLPDAERFEPRHLLAAFEASDARRLETAIKRLQTTAGAIELDCVLRHPGAASVVHVVVESEWKDGRLQRLLGTAQDVTAARRAEQDIQRLAHYDSMTGLPNRNLWRMRARSALQVAQRHGDCMAVLFLDLDQFKTVNDSLGHRVGDGLLAVVGRRLQSCMREEDLLARLGGDEFVALLPRLPRSDDAGTVARKMLDVLARPMVVDGHELTLSASIGIAVYPADGTDVDTLLQHADTAMYSAKDAGRNTFQFFVHEMNVRVLRRLQLESGLRRALDRDEFTLHYQPQVDAETRALVGVEALLRWQHPERGPMLPGEFIPVAEESGLIIPIGDWVMRSAFAQQAHWRERGRQQLSVAVNISALQFARPDFTDRVAQVIAETGADPRRIVLEITESALMDHSPSLTQRLQDLTGMGLTLALDDFGTGYSSLAYLKRLPLDRLKLDRSFVRDLPDDPDDVAIALAAISVARDLGMQVIAEGVETQGQREFLIAHGCRWMQGFLFSEPLPVQAFDRRFPPSPESE
ncbi:EAL domain-containing protein [Thioalkalivibrio paradoxus]|uniref:cyclic-guanylate-specific phosphodiesterase n=1 Tax=Thioalkalivibrio paradoxus ARh 1 TaxID=713585 RepID=W0DPJ7_9GAMM|nr:EAL domain-containing protein [Thioalkalivibrio paradoxus]AHE98928.1 diguanylate cyclase [Thioalkalivibrio paradoxus ARh 1]